MDKVNSKTEAASFIARFLIHISKRYSYSIFKSKYQDNAYFYLDMTYDTTTGTFWSSQYFFHY